MGRFEAGAARADITPPIGSELVGYNSDPSTGLNDPLWARSLAFRSQGQCALVIVLDLLGIELSTTRRIRALISARLPIAPEDVLICCTHNHSGPSWLDFYAVPIDPTWKEGAINTIVDVAATAFERLGPAQVGAGSTVVHDIGANRRARLDDGSIFHFMGRAARRPPDGRTVVEKGVIDPELSVIGVRDAAGRIIAVLVNYAAHPWLYNGSRISSEISGACVEWVEQQLRPANPDVVALFTPGAGSNITTVQHQTPIPEELRDKERWFAAERLRMGEILGRGALQALEEVSEFADAGPVASEVCQIAAPVYEQTLKVVLEKSGGLPPTDLTMDTEVQVLGIGDIVLVGLPSEVYVEYGLEIKRRSRHANPFVLSYCNDYFADIITREAAVEGTCPEVGWTKVLPDIRDLIMGCLEPRVLYPAATRPLGLRPGHPPLNKRASMQYCRLGQTDMQLSRVGLGGLLAHYWEGEAGHPPPEEKRRIYLRAAELGVNLFDMGYGDEVHIPEELKGPAGDRCFSLKVGHPVAAELEATIDRHLADLRREAIDILRVHYYAYMADEALRQRIAALKRAGKVRSLCLIRHFEADQTAYVHSGPEPAADADLVIYNYVCRGQEPAMERAARAGKGVLVMKALGGQYLSWTDKNRTDWAAATEETLMQLSPLGESMREEVGLVHAFAVGPWRELARPGENAARTGSAVAWLLESRYVSSVYVGVASVAELEAALEEV